MEPTKEIVELSRKLKELGYKQKLDKGDWKFIKGEVALTMLDLTERGLDVFSEYEDYFPIPSISQALDWMRDRGEKYFPILFEDKPHEEMLKAMIKVLEK